MSYVPNSSGTSVVTADGQTVARGSLVRVYNMTINSGAGGNAVVALKSGGSSGTTYVSNTGTVSQGVTFNYGNEGILLTDGMYVDVDANTDSAVISYSVVL